MNNYSHKDKKNINSKISIFHELASIRQCQKRPDGIFGSFMTRPFSFICAFIFSKLKITPNMVTFLSFVLCLVACGLMLLDVQNKVFYFTATFLWWIAAIFDASDGDLARYTGQGSDFGGWFDSYLDRLKEFIIFATFSYLVFKGYGKSNWGVFLDFGLGNDCYLLMGFLSILSNVMSGWITDTKKVFCQIKRIVEVKFSEKYSFGMADTRDFFIILSLLLGEFRIALYVYGMIFPIVLLLQTIVFYRRYGISGEK